jgi:hypothetical protein
MADEKGFAELGARLERLETLLLGRIPQVFDPPPDDWGRWGGWGGFIGSRAIPIPFPIPQPGDPVPMDISRLSRAQLQVSLESIKAQRIRLDAVENMINQQLKAK